MRHNGRVEKRGRLKGILVGEVRSDDQFARLGKFAIRDKMASDELKTLHKNLLGLQVAPGKLLQNLQQQRLDLLLGQRKQARDNPDDTLLIRRRVRPNQHPRAVRIDEDGSASNDGR